MTKKKRGPVNRLGDRVRATDEHVSAGYDNVFEVFGGPNADERLAKAELTRIIRQQIQAHGWNGIQAAAHLDTAASEVSDLMRGKIGRFSQERLLRFLNKLDLTVIIRVGPRPKRLARAGVGVELVVSF